MVQAVLKRLPFDRMYVHFRLEELVTVASSVLGVVHRSIRFLQERLCVGAVIRIGDNTDAPSYMQLMLLNLVRFPQRPEYFLRSDGCILCVLYFPQQDHEFIAPEAADGIRTAHAREKSTPDGLQQTIAHDVTQ